MAFRLAGSMNATGTTGAIYPTSPPSKHAMQVEIDTNVTACTVALEVTLDNRSAASPKWVPLVTHVFTAGEITARVALFTAIDAPVIGIRANVTNLVGGNVTEILYEPGTT